VFTDYPSNNLCGHHDSLQVCELCDLVSGRERSRRTGSTTKNTTFLQILDWNSLAVLKWLQWNYAIVLFRIVSSGLKWIFGDIMRQQPRMMRQKSRMLRQNDSSHFFTSDVLRLTSYYQTDTNMESMTAHDSW